MNKVKISKKLIKKVKPFYAINWDFNKKTIYKVDVISSIIDYVIKELEMTNKKATLHFVEDYDSFKELVDSDLKYHFMYRREYEIAIGDLPYFDFEESNLRLNKYIDSLEKVSVYDQIKDNIDFIVDHLWNTLEIEDFLKRKFEGVIKD